MKKVFIYILLLILSHKGYAQTEEEWYKTWYFHSTFDANNPQTGQYMTLVIYHEVENGYRVRSDLLFVLDSVGAVAAKFPEMMFALELHTDCRNDSLYNLDMSQRQANMICAYINRNRKEPLPNLAGIGKGESEPLNDCRCEKMVITRECTEEEHQQNRRTVLRVIGKR